MSDTNIKIALKGSALADGTIELRRLTQFGDRLQKAVDRIAYSIEKESGGRRKLSEVRQDTALRLINTHKGSFVTEMGFVRPPVLFEGHYDIATVAIEKLVLGLEYFHHTSNDSELPKGYDQGVLAVLKELGKTLTKGIEQIEFSVSTPRNHIIRGVYDKHTQAHLLEAITAPEEKIAAVTGTLVMANFRYDRYERYRCNLFTDAENQIACTFDEDVADSIGQAMRKNVNAIGIATIDPADDEIATFHIKQLVILDDDNMSPQRLTDLLDSYIEENDTIASFRRSWQEAIEGEVHAVASLWDGIDAE